MDVEGYLRFFLALVFVLALIGLLTAVARRFGFAYRAGTRGRRGRRLSIIEIMPLDAKRRLVLIRRDAIEHLIILGSGPDVVGESGIPAPAGDFPAVPDEALGAAPTGGSQA